jgi:hypothetical protein
MHFYLLRRSWHCQHLLCIFTCSGAPGQLLGSIFHAYLPAPALLGSIFYHFYLLQRSRAASGQHSLCIFTCSGAHTLRIIQLCVRSRFWGWSPSRSLCVGFLVVAGRPSVHVAVGTFVQLCTTPCDQLDATGAA